MKFQKAILPLGLSVIAIAWCFTALAGTSRGVLVAAILIILGVLIFYVTKGTDQNYVASSPAYPSRLSAF